MSINNSIFSLKERLSRNSTFLQKRRPLNQSAQSKEEPVGLSIIVLLNISEKKYKKLLQNLRYIDQEKHMTENATSTIQTLVMLLEGTTILRQVIAP